VSTIETDGYLSNQITYLIKKNWNQNSKWFNLCKEINRFSHATMFKMIVHNKCKPELMVALLYIRSISNFQGVIIMAERGMVNEAKVLLRCLIECGFAVVAIDKDKTIVDRLILDDRIQQLGKLKAMKRNIENGVPLPKDAFSIDEIKTRIRDVISEIKKSNIEKFTTRDLAEIAGLIKTYDSAYKVLSDTIHVSVRDLEQYLELNEKGEIKQLLSGPDVKEIDMILLTASEIILSILESISNIFSLSYDKAWDRILKEFNKLSSAYRKKILS
jgi:hypothetical protein